jgi:hypothetical protein
MKLILPLFWMIAANLTWAGDPLTVSLYSDYQEGIGRITLTQVNNVLTFTQDTNKCTYNEFGIGICTRLASPMIQTQLILEKTFPQNNGATNRYRLKGVEGFALVISTVGYGTAYRLLRIKDNQVIGILMMRPLN